MFRIILVISFFLSSAFANTKFIGDMQVRLKTDVSQLKAEKDFSKRWLTFDKLKAHVNTVKTDDEIADKLYINGLSIALESIDKKKVETKQCDKIREDLDRDFSPSTKDITKAPQFYQDAIMVLDSLCS